MRFYPLCALLTAALLPRIADAAVSVPSFFSDHMVLQREAPIPVWGWADADESVSVQLGDQAAVTTKAGGDGRWQLALPARPAGGPYVMVISSSNKIKIADVLVGEVWLCSGQSNMEMTVNGSLNAATERAAATDDQIRQLYVPKRPLSQPDEKLQATWTVASPDTVGNFTACGYFMARELRKQLHVPIGLLHSSWGGTRIEPWTTPAGFKQVPALADISAMLAEFDPTTPAYKKRLDDYITAMEVWTKQARAAQSTQQPIPPAPKLAETSVPLAERKDPQQQPTTLYNGMIHALVGYGMRGAIWYQGESNHYEGKMYTEKMKALIGGWRSAWGIGDFPFNFVQIAPFEYGNEDPTVMPRFWVAQSEALQIPHTGMVVTTDIGELKDIHPKNKQEVGRRLALIALNKTYQKPDIVCEGPTFKSMAVEGNKIRVLFDHAAGLSTRDGKAPDWFEVIGEDSDWTAATAQIDGTAVVVSAPAVNKPVAVRFSWHKNAMPNLQNGAGLPAPAFSEGGIAYSDQLPHIDEAKQYTVVYDVDLAHLSGDVHYEVNNSDAISGFERIAYLLELQQEGRGVKYAWVSLDAFTADVHKIAIPTVNPQASFQKIVKNVRIASNVKELSVGTVANGGIEFWPNNYGPANVSGVPGASNDIYDFGDQMSDPVEGYGCMQIHNLDAKQTIFAINNFRAGAGADLGIGNSSGKSSDWTFTSNAATYVTKRLRVFVLKK